MSGPRIQAALGKLRALREGDEAIAELIDCGQAAVGPLREFLFSREPCGLFQPRCQAVEALAKLGAKAVLLEFLTAPRSFADPVEQAGEDAVLSFVARALTRWPDDATFLLLLAVAKRKLLPGIVDALGEYRRMDALPVLAAALAEDFCRSAAETAFRKLGPAACSCLLSLAVRTVPLADVELESSLRLRRSALNLFDELYPRQAVPQTVWELVLDADIQVALTACSICLARDSGAGREKVLLRLAELWESGDWAVRMAVEELY